MAPVWIVFSCNNFLPDFEPLAGCNYPRTALYGMGAAALIPFLVLLAYRSRVMKEAQCAFQPMSDAIGRMKSELFDPWMSSVSQKLTFGQITDNR